MVNSIEQRITMSLDGYLTRGVEVPARRIRPHLPDCAQELVAHIRHRGMPSPDDIHKMLSTMKAGAISQMSKDVHVSGMDILHALSLNSMAEPALRNALAFFETHGTQHSSSHGAHPETAHREGGAPNPQPPPPPGPQ